MILSVSTVVGAALVQASVAGPGVRNAHGAAYDLRDSSLVLFGGASASEVRGDTWRWMEGSWRVLTAAGPGPRTFPAMAYDAARGEIVLFGGNRVLFGDSTHPAAMLGDTWVLRGDTWRARSANGPPPRAESAMAYDPVRRRTVLFGGRDESGGQTIRLGDTWEWDGSSWIRMSTSGPSARSGAAMAYDPGRRAVVLFGGSGGPRGDTWAWNGRAWDSVPIPPAPGRFNAVMAWDPRANRLVRFGGWDGEARTSETWELGDDGWASVGSSGPSARNHAAMVTAADRGSLLLYGGHDGDNVFGDLWERRRGMWVPHQSAAPLRRVANGH
jgi:hypothetical protein